jgi:phosphoribosylformimino-5-aminoimidazole carboxamide ribotide isomerase
VELYCAVDILGGAAVRLRQGDFDERTDHGDPLELAARYVASGARYLHVVDLDAARSGEAINISVVLGIVKSVGVPVQVGGGARTAADVEQLLDEGAARVVVTTAAVEDPEMVAKMAIRYPGRIALGVDHRGAVGGSAGGPASELDATVAVRGWKEPGSVTVSHLLERFAAAPLGAVVVTSIARDGMMSGPDSDGLVAVMRRTAHPVIASGGVRSVADLEMLAAVRVEGPDGKAHGFDGAIVGKALAEGKLEVEEAIAACEQSG